MKRIYYWVGKHVHSTRGTLIFAFLMLIEGILFMPVSTLLSFYCLQNRKKSFEYAFIATVMSVFGALLGYYIGYLIWSHWGASFISNIIGQENFDVIKEKFETYKAGAVFLVALTPVPFKALTLTAGFCRLSLFPFIFMCIISRGIKFFTISTLAYIWGDKMQIYLDKYFYYFIAIGIISFIAFIKLVH